MAEKIAELIGGTPGETRIDGRIAKLATGGRAGEAAMFIERAGYLYEIRYQHVGRNPGELEAIRDGWHWDDIAPPVKHSELRQDFIPVLDQCVLRLPTHMRPWQVPPTPGTANFAAVDITGQRVRTEFRMEVMMHPSMQGKPLNELATRISEPIQQQMGAKNPIAWRLLEGKNDRIISQTLVPPAPPNEPNFRPRTGSCLGIVALDGQRRVLFNFIANSEDPDARFAYLAMGEAILRSVLPIEAVMPGRTPATSGPPSTQSAPSAPAR
jgi:hypothetical protein